MGMSNYFEKLNRKLNTYDEIDDYLYTNGLDEYTILLEFRHYDWLDYYMYTTFKNNFKYDDMIILNKNDIYKILKDISIYNIGYEIGEEDKKQIHYAIPYIKKLLTEDFENNTIYYQTDI